MTQSFLLVFQNTKTWEMDKKQELISHSWAGSSKSGSRQVLCLWGQLSLETAPYCCRRQRPACFHPSLLWGFWGTLREDPPLWEKFQYKFWKGHKYSNQGTLCAHRTKTGKLDSSVARWRPSGAFGVYGLGVETTTLLCSEPEWQHSTHWHG